MPSFAPRTLGRTGLRVGPLGLGSSYGIGGADVERAFERGCNYLYWGTLRRRGFGGALRRLAARARDRMVLVVQSYARVGFGVRVSVERALRRVGTDHADVLLLGWWQQDPSGRVLDAARRLREQGKVRFLAASTHRRPQAARWLGGGSDLDVIHVRYNAAHRGAEREVFPHKRDGAPGLVAFTATRWGSLLKPRAGVERTPTAGDCYRFALTQPAVDLCLAGPRNGADLDAALAALERGPMDEDEVAWIRGAGDAVYAARKGRGETTFLSR